jgi:hypothetical protein
VKYLLFSRVGSCSPGYFEFEIGLLKSFSSGSISGF